MAAHWSDGYIGIPHATLDCGELVERVLREQLGRDVRFPRRESDNTFHRAALIKANAADFARKVKKPFDGCGVMFLARGRMAHIGLYCAFGGGYILHSDSTFGASVRTPVGRFVPPNYRIEGFYEWL